MLRFILRRLLLMIPTVIVISIITFIVIQLPPGDFLTQVVAQLQEQGQTVEKAELEMLQERYGLGKPLYIQYIRWIVPIITRGDFGRSFSWNMPVSQLIWARIGLTFMLSFSTMLFTWIVAFPIGVYSAIKQYSIGDYVATFMGFIGLAIPSFIFALVLMYIAFKYFGQNIGGLFSPNMIDAPWSFAKFIDLLQHLWIPVIVLGTSGTASMIRIMRANLLDEKRKTYVTAARARGIAEGKMILQYPVRVALNPFVSTLGWSLPGLISGSTVTSIVLSLPTTGPLLYNALQSQDMFLAGGFLLMLSVLTVIGTLLSDILLAVVDPRIRYGGMD
ncbi:MAG: ABC transporter permease [Christensenellales bacterium]|jgi:peptide/nickel transport system permease protein